MRAETKRSRALWEPRSASRVAVTVRLAMLVSVVACGPEGEGEGEGPAQPAKNLLLITADTLRADHLGCYGEQRPLTPTLDVLAAGGVQFQRALAPMPQTAPSHASLFTGLYPLEHGLTSNTVPISLKRRTLAEAFLDAGFVCGAYTHIFPFSQARLTQGFMETRHDPELSAPELEPWVAQFLDNSVKSEPFFLWIHLFLTHSPLEPPEEYRERWVKHTYDGELDHDFRVLHGIHRGEIEAPPEFFDNYRDLYAAQVNHLDDRVAALLELLEQRDARDETMVVFVGDHGEMLADGNVGLHAPFLLPETLRVPLLVAAGDLARGHLVEETVRTQDLFATLVEYFQLGAASSDSSRSLLPAMWGEFSPLEPSAVFATLPAEYLGRDRGAEDGADPESALAVCLEDRLWVRRGERLESFPLVGSAAEAELGAEGEAARSALDRWLSTLQIIDTEEVVDEATRRLLRELGYEVSDDEDAATKAPWE